MRCLPQVALPLLALLVACHTSADVIEDNLITPESIQAVALGTIRFDYSSWTNRDEKDIAKSKEHEAGWSKALGDAFLAQIRERGLGSTEVRTPVDITIIDLDPGSQAARAWVGFGAGTGRITAQVAPSTHGSFRMNGKITGGSWGGRFEDVMATLGEAIADHLADRVQKK
ncbi:MAG: DUF4410 domain-containing protein [Planctomycetes bacterium]|nr:DUF4410 domain-containing protein [Planctomycetota bacterium]